MSWFKKLISFITPPSLYTEVRARDKDGRYVGDDPTTPNVNEAYKKVRKKRSKR
tara:strand:- start:2299 stop:2460 length:162 start_codon:yes stop_codon:yes gene_type:complete